MVHLHLKTKGMKNYFLKTVFLFGIIIISTCKNNSNAALEIVNNQHIERLGVGKGLVLKTIEGKVLEIYDGKDGYTAKIETAQKKIYFAIISYANLKDSNQFKSVTTGDMLKVTGDFWKIEGQNQITVRTIEK